MNEKRDIHQSQRRFDYYYDRLDRGEFSPRQTTQIKKFILEAQIGKNSKKKVGNHRLIANFQSFYKLNTYFKKDFDKLTEKDMIKFHQDLESNRIKQVSGQPYKESSKNELIRTLKRYLKWIWKENDYNRKAKWLKEYDEISDVPALSIEEVTKLSEGCKFLRDEALTFFLADSGCRIEEALNLKISDCELKKKEDGDEFYIINIRVSKTLPRKISIPLASKILTKWLSEHPSITDKEAYLFPCTYNAYRKVLRLTSKKVLKVVVTPHQLRHSSASYYCKKINNPYKFCYRYGWHFNSPMAKRYIDRTQLEEDAQEQLDNLVKNSKVEDLESQVEIQNKEIQDLKLNMKEQMKMLLAEMMNPDENMNDPKGEGLKVILNSIPKTK